MNLNYNTIFEFIIDIKNEPLLFKSAVNAKYKSVGCTEKNLTDLLDVHSSRPKYINIYQGLIQNIVLFCPYRHYMTKKSRAN